MLLGISIEKEILKRARNSVIAIASGLGWAGHGRRLDYGCIEMGMSFVITEWKSLDPRAMAMPRWLRTTAAPGVHMRKWSAD